MSVSNPLENTSPDIQQKKQWTEPKLKCDKIARETDSGRTVDGIETPVYRVS
ncbi:hypothetical protein GCM10007939_20830 [Amylibacter marinus]|uniref:Uncharacterized protein n=1 Tax=Amylibacter marinus TaxID=1475483 RepID=A0ABQ5VX10_9RHOB|nr:hypothetical protein [Amylibacter marinus]GLQ35800.1 hypothetical protein GCM10007939_20830 [Amylibacter marinus]